MKWWAKWKHSNVTNEQDRRFHEWLAGQKSSRVRSRQPHEHSVMPHRQCKKFCGEKRRWWHYGPLENYCFRPGDCVSQTCSLSEAEQESVQRKKFKVQIWSLPDWFQLYYFLFWSWLTYWLIMNFWLIVIITRCLEINSPRGICYRSNRVTSMMTQLRLYFRMIRL